MNNIPTSFIVIGTMKGGTGSLYNYLGEHPNICMSIPKETDFFLERNEQSKSWYQNCFREKADEYGEVSPNYTKYPGFSGVPKRIYKLIPNVKLIYIVRDPIERAISHYAHNRLKGREEKTINEAFTPVKKSGYINVSRYYFQLSKYLKYFSMDDILVIQTEKLRDERRKVMNRVFEHIGVEDDHLDSKNLKKVYHTTKEKKEKTKVAEILTETYIGRKIKNEVKKMVPYRIVKVCKKLLYNDFHKKKPSKIVKNKVSRYLARDIDRFRKLTEREYSEWAI